jgi:acetolactate synthase-1/2/3 large subunit
MNMATSKETQQAPVPMPGNEILAETFRRAGTKAIFFVPTFLYPTLVSLADDGMKRGTWPMGTRRRPTSPAW